MVGKIIKRTYMGLIFLFLYMPILVLIVFSFNESKSRGHWGGFTLKWYGELFRDPDITKALYYTFLVAFLSSLIATVIGTISAIGIHNMGLLGKKVILNVNYLPVLNPDIVTGVALMTLFISMNMRLGFTTMLISHVVFNIPYVILSVLPKLRQMNRHMAEAALDLGATPFYAMRKVIIPEIMPGVITGALMAFTLSVDDFVISFFNTGSGVTNLSIIIFSMARRGIKPSINALSTLMLITVVILLLIINKRSTKGDELIP
ncbi:MAG: ABC transporter permease [Clostridiaceae bacterium]|nr:ABC transporter permease [Clostridiaceae bacterium]